MASNSKPKIDPNLFAAAIKDAPKSPVQKAVPIDSKKDEEVILTSMYFKIDKRLKKDLIVYLAQEDLYIQDYLNLLIEKDLREKGALRSY